MRRLLPPLALAATAIVAAPAAAQAPAQIAVALSPATAGAGTTVALSAKGGDGSELGGRQPASFVLDVQQGFRLDPAAVSELCTSAQAQDQACPQGSSIGGGTAMILARNALLPGGQRSFTAKLTVDLGAPAQAGDLGTVQLGFTEPETGSKGSATGRIIPISGGPYGLELRFDGIGGGDALPAGTTVELQDLELHVGASRTVVTKTTKHVRVKLKHPKRSKKTGRLVRTKLVTRTTVKKTAHALLTNPATCTGTWAAQATVSFTDGSTLVRPLTTPCSP